MFHIFQQGPSESTLSFQTLDQAIKNISKDINATTKKSWTQKHKELEAKPRRTKVGAKVARKEVVKKRTKVIKIFSSSNNEVSQPPLEEKLYIVLKATPKND